MFVYWVNCDDVKDKCRANANGNTGDNYWIYDGLLINDVPDGDASQETLMGVIAGWDAFNKTVSDGRAVLAWQTANGSKEIPARIGTEANPYAIRTAQDLAAIRNILFAGDNYLTVENDIDMTDVPYVAPLGNNNFSGVVVHLDGKQHVISNLKVEKAIILRLSVYSWVRSRILALLMLKLPAAA